MLALTERPTMHKALSAVRLGAQRLPERSVELLDRTETSISAVVDSILLLLPDRSGVVLSFALVALPRLVTSRDYYQADERGSGHDDRTCGEDAGEPPDEFRSRFSVTCRNNTRAVGMNSRLLPARPCRITTVGVAPSKTEYEIVAPSSMRISRLS
jgi:hypothetical protein